MIVLSVSAHAGALRGVGAGERAEFFDWEFAKKVWFEMNTWEAEEKEWAKYSADFERWYSEHKHHVGSLGLKEVEASLTNYSEAQKHNIRRGWDIQLAWDAFEHKKYGPWVRRYREVVTYSTRADEIAALMPFAQSLAETNAHMRRIEPGCVPQKWIHQCGAFPDWRSPEMKAEERKLEAMRAKRLGK